LILGAATPPFTLARESQLKKIFVLDTNVLLTNPNAIFQFDDNDVVLPICVIEEVDTFKKGLNEIGRSARQVSRILDELRSRGSLSTGIKLFPDRENSGILTVCLETDMNVIPANLQRNPDNLILANAISQQKLSPDIPVVLITKDSNLRIKADAFGITAEDYKADKVDLDDLYTGIAEFEVDSSVIENFRLTGSISLDLDLSPNQFVILRDAAHYDSFCYGIFSTTRDAVVALQNDKKPIWGIQPRNLEQVFALELLLNDDIKLVSLVGAAGTGKTLLAIASGLQKTTEDAKYIKMLVSRPIFPLGKDVGYLPGTIEEKMNPWMQPIYDNLEFLLGGSKRSKSKSRSYEELIAQGIIAVEPLTYIRGRSIPQQYFIVDEAQNLTPHEIKTILTRAGENTKIILTGDPYQIDNPYVDAASNGLTYIVDRFRKQAIAGHITLVKGERSPLATIAAEIL